MARRWVVKKKTPPWIMVVIYSVVGYAVILAAMAFIGYYNSMR